MSEASKVVQALLMAQGVAPESLASMSHEELLTLRKALPQIGEAQDYTAPYEHRAFAREQVAENPWNAAGMAVAIPAYTAAKTLRMVGARSKPSLEEMLQGFAGIADGLGQAWNKTPN